MTRTVAIVGGSPSRDMVLKEPPSTEVWGMNYDYDKLPRYDRWFDIHNHILVLDTEKAKTHRKRLSELNCPVYILKAHPELPNAQIYPVRTITNGMSRPYLTSSASYMLAMAIHEKADVVKVFGVGMDTMEHRHQRACFEYWMGVAAGKGIKVQIFGESVFLTGIQYGLSDNTTPTKEGLMEQLAMTISKENEVSQKLSQIQGYRMAIQSMLHSFDDPPNKTEMVLLGEGIRDDGKNGVPAASTTKSLTEAR